MAEARRVRPRRKPPNWSWGVDDPVPIRPRVVLAAQHAALALVFLVYPILAARVAGLPHDVIETLVGATIVAFGLTTMAQCWPRGPGSGFFIVQFPNPIQIPAATLALAVGGIPLLAGLSILCGLFQIALARMARLLRPVLSPFVCGVAVLMLAMSLIGPALDRILSDVGEPVQHFLPEALLVAVATLGPIIVAVTFGPRRAKLVAVAIGVSTGWLTAWLVGLTPPDALARIAAVPLIGPPHLFPDGWSIETAELPAVLLAGFTTSIITLGLMLSVDRATDADWRRADLARASRGMQVDGGGTLLSGIIGGYPLACSTAHAGLVYASGAASGRIGVLAGAFMVAAAFVPKLVTALTTVPVPVIGSVLLYAATYLMVTGMDLILSRRLSDRRIFIVGVSVISGMSVELAPFAYAGVPDWAAPLFQTPLGVAVIVAVTMSLVFRIGIRRTAEVGVAPAGEMLGTARTFLERQGDLWGTRREVIGIAVPATAQVLDALVDSGMAERDLRLRAHFDEIDLDVTILYRGERLPEPEPGAVPSPDDLLGDRAAVARFLSHYLPHLGDRLVRGREGEFETLTLRFEN